MATTLRPLGETGTLFLDSGDDIRGRTVLDSDDEEIGTVNELLIDSTEEKVRFLRIASGGFLGIGASTFLIPIETITHIDENYVHIDRTRDIVAGAPRYQPELVDQAYQDRVYGHYGYDPYWTPGYNYPTYPPPPPR